MGRRSSLLIVILVFAVLVPMLYYGTTSDSIQFNPQITKQEAFAVVEQYLQQRVEGFGGVAIYCCFGLSQEDVGYILKDEFLAKGYDLPLRYYHQNSTISVITGDEEAGNYTIRIKCDVQDCDARASESRIDALTGHLSYVMDVAVIYDGQSVPTGGFFVDARSGKIIHSGFFCIKDIMEWCKQDTPMMNQ
jgi:hypothetical protein